MLSDAKKTPRSPRSGTWKQTWQESGLDLHRTLMRQNGDNCGYQPSWNPSLSPPPPPLGGLEHVAEALYLFSHLQLIATSACFVGCGYVRTASRTRPPPHWPAAPLSPALLLQHDATQHSVLGQQGPLGPTCCMGRSASYGLAPLGDGHCPDPVSCDRSHRPQDTKDSSLCD